jgi:lysophospholipase L1-like esterase
MKKFLLFAAVALVFFLAGVVVDHLELPPYKQMMAVKQSVPLISRLSVLVKHWRGDDAPADIIMLGDSLTDSGDWPTLLGKPDVLNYGEDGDTTNGVIRRLYRVVAHKPRLVFLMIGVNNFLGDTPPDITERNIELIASRLAKSGAKPVVQSILFVVADAPFVRERIAQNFNPDIAAVNERLKAWCADNTVAFLDLNPVLSAGQSLKADVTYDGVHLNDHGYRLWAESLRQFIARNGP